MLLPIVSNEAKVRRKRATFSKIIFPRERNVGLTNENVQQPDVTYQCIHTTGKVDNMAAHKKERVAKYSNTPGNFKIVYTPGI